MSKFKCIDCGQEFDAKFSFCPNCGCPSSSCQIIEEETALREEPVQQETTESEQPYAGLQQAQQPLNQNAGQQMEPLTYDIPQPSKRRTQPGTFEIICYVLAGICAVLFLIQQTSSGGYVNLDGSNRKLIWEIAAFSWLIVGRLTALVNR